MVGCVLIRILTPSCSPSASLRPLLRSRSILVLKQTLVEVSHFLSAQRRAPLSPRLSRGLSLSLRLRPALLLLSGVDEEPRVSHGTETQTLS